MPTKRQVDAEVSRLVDANKAAMDRYRGAWGTPDLADAAREVDASLERLKAFAREHAPLYVTYPD